MIPKPLFHQLIILFTKLVFTHVLPQEASVQIPRDLVLERSDFPFWNATEYPNFSCFDHSRAIGNPDAADCFRAVAKVKEDPYYSVKMKYSRIPGPDIRRVPITYPGPAGNCIVVLDSLNTPQLLDHFDLVDVWKRGSSLIRDCVASGKHIFGGVYDVGDKKGFFVAVTAPPTLASQKKRNVQGNHPAVKALTEVEDGKASPVEPYLSLPFSEEIQSNLAPDAHYLRGLLLPNWAVDCIHQRPQPAPVVPLVTKEDCLAATEKIQDEAKSRSVTTWSRSSELGSRRVPEQWESGGCKVVLNAFDPKVVDSFRPIDVAISAAKIIGRCLTGEGEMPPLGGFVRIGHRPGAFHVVISHLAMGDMIPNLNSTEVVKSVSDVQ